jgi:capsular exopolysaccharide synthesis family protein
MSIAVPEEPGDDGVSIADSYPESDRGADQWHWWHVFRRRLPVFLVIFCAVLGAAIFYAQTAPRIYVATAGVQIEPQRGDPVQPTGMPAPEAAPSADYIETQIVVMQSPQIAAAVVRSLDLTRDPEFAQAAQGIADQDERVAATAQTLLRAVNIRRVGQTFVINITATSRSGGQAARIANEYAAQYLLGIQAALQSFNQRQDVQVDSKLEQLRRQAEAADGLLQRYKIAHGLMSAEGATMAEQETSDLNNQIAAARADLAEKQGRLGAARRQLAVGGGGSDVTSALNSGTVGALRAQEAESSRTLAQLRERYGQKHPSVGQEQERLRDIQRQIQNEIDRILSSLAAEVNVSSSRLQSLLGSQAASRGRLASNESAQVGFLELQRKADAAKTIYESFLRSSKGAEARTGLEQPSARISSAAVTPLSPASPNVTLIYLVSTLFAAVAGIAGVALAELLDARISTRADIERGVGTRYLGAIPDLESTLDGARMTEPPQDYIISHPLSSFAESLRNLRAAATLRGHRPPKVLAITSALPLEGKTTTAICVARTLAMSGARTVIVDCDLRRHSASNLLLDGREGKLPEVLAGTAPIGAALVRDRVTDLEILGVTNAPTDGRDLLASNLVQILFAELRAQFDFVVLDTAPVLGVADARSVAREADATILLARWRQTSVRAANAAVDLLVAADAKVIGIALTQVDVHKFGSSEEDLYGYHSRFTGYYSN